MTKQCAIKPYEHVQTNTYSYLSLSACSLFFSNQTHLLKCVVKHVLCEDYALRKRKFIEHKRNRNMFEFVTLSNHIRKSKKGQNLFFVTSSSLAAFSCQKRKGYDHVNLFKSSVLLLDVFKNNVSKCTPSSSNMILLGITVFFEHVLHGEKSFSKRFFPVTQIETMILTVKSRNI